MTSLRLVAIIAVTATLGLAGCAQTRYGHMAHHGGAAPAPGQAMPMAGPGGPMARMDDHMTAMRAMHDRMSRARTPEERNALIAEHHKLMQDGMGMMGGMGPGMGGGMGPMAMLDLSEAQTAQLKKIQTESMKKQRALLLQMWDEQANLGDLLNADKRDPAAIGKAYGKLADVQRQALEARIDAENKAAAVLTKEQMMQMRRGYGRGMMGY